MWSCPSPLRRAGPQPGLYPLKPFQPFQPRLGPRPLCRVQQPGQGHAALVPGRAPRDPPQGPGLGFLQICPQPGSRWRGEGLAHGTVWVRSVPVDMSASTEL